MPSTRSAQLPRAVRISTGIRRPFSRQRLRTDRPSMPRQAEIEHDRAVVLGVAAKPRLLAVRRRFDDVAGRAERPLDLGRDSRIVLDHEHAHHFSLIRSTSAALGVDIDLEQPSLVVDHAELVEPASLLALDFDADDLARQSCPRAAAMISARGRSSPRSTASRSASCCMARSSACARADRSAAAAVKAIRKKRLLPHDMDHYLAAQLTIR